MSAIPLRSHAITALIAMSIFWCGAVAGMLVLHSTSATEPTVGAAASATPVASSTVAQTKTVRLVPVHSALAVETKDSPASMTFEDRWSARELAAAPPSSVADAKAQLASDQAKPVAPEQQDKVCGGRGRNYFYIGHHKYWHCRR
jgi:uncharacterized membrane protein